METHNQFMFTGIIEATGRVSNIKHSGSNITFEIESEISPELKVDQSVSHNGVCLTVEKVEENLHSVTAVEETLKKSNLSDFEKGTLVNLERCMVMNGRLDGHIVQGHVDQTAKCTEKVVKDGSTDFTFTYDDSLGNITVEKGSVSVNGVSLTCFNCRDGQFTVTIIPYTLEHTNFQNLKEGDTVNLEFDIIGKYVSKLLNKG